MMCYLSFVARRLFIHCNHPLLLTFATSNDRKIAWARAAVKDDRFLHPWDEEMGPFSNHYILNTSESVKDDSPVTCIHYKIGKQTHLNSIVILYEKRHSKLLCYTTTILARY